MDESLERESKVPKTGVELREPGGVQRSREAAQVPTVRVWRMLDPRPTDQMQNKTQCLCLATPETMGAGGGTRGWVSQARLGQDVQITL